MIVDVLFVAAFIVLLVTIYHLKFNSPTSIQNQPPQKKNQQQPMQPLTPVTSTQQSPPEEQWVQSDSQQSEGEQVDERKKLRKQRKANQRKQRKEAHEQYLQQLKQKQLKQQQQAEKRQKMEQQLRRKEQQVIEKLREEERIRRQLQFNKWKDSFSVEQEGRERLSAEQQKLKEATFKKQLLGIIKKRKLTILQDLSHQLKLSTKQLVSRIRQLQQQHLVSGIFDQRGKYLMIEAEEWLAIKSYILAKGRVKKEDIMKQCAKLIKIPEEAQESLLLLIADESSNNA